MTVPMIVLAVGSVGAGALLALGGRLAHWLEPVTGAHEAHHAVPVWVMTTITLSVVTVGIVIAYTRYARRPVPETAPAEVSALTVAARRDLYGDAVNEAVFMRPGAELTEELVKFDDRGVEGAATGLAALVSGSADRLRRTQTGFARSYAFLMLAGAALLVGLILAVNL